MTTRFVISGTDTGIGKTIFSAALASALSAYYWKPVQSGLAEETDSEIVARLGEVPNEKILPEVYKLNTPVSPHLSAQIDGTLIHSEKFALPPLQSTLIIEGAGGLLVPLTRSIVFADIFKIWQIPVILCARTTLGTINHTLLSLEALKTRSIPIHGICFIGDENLDTQNTIAAFGQIHVLGRLPILHTLTAKELNKAFFNHFSIHDFE